LLSKNLVFDYGTHYRILHPTLTSSRDFRITDDIWNDFLAFISDKEYDYVTKSEKSLEEMKKNTEDEKYFEAMEKDFEAMKAHLAHNKKEDVTKNREEISRLLQEEIASRYYFQKGKIEASLQGD
jgi:carboxyl-terminal processing protease